MVFKINVFLLFEAALGSLRYLWIKGFDSAEGTALPVVDIEQKGVTLSGVQQILTLEI